MYWCSMKLSGAYDSEQVQAKHAGVAGYTIEVQVFGFGHLYVPFRPPVSTTLRAGSGLFILATSGSITR